MMSIVASIGTFVNNETTLNDINSLVDGTFCGLIKLRKSLVFWTEYSLLLKGAKILAKCMAR